MAISLANILAAFNDYLTAKAATDTAHQAIVDLGPYPMFPLEITTDSDYNDVLTSQTAWTAAYPGLYATYQTALTDQRTAELAVVTVIQTGAGPTQGADEWFEMAGEVTYWIGYSSQELQKIGEPYLVVRSEEPTEAFINS